MCFYKRFIKKQNFIIPKFKSVETQTKEFETKEWLYKKFVDEQNNEDSTLEQSMKSLVYEEVKTSIPNSKYENHSNDSQQTAIEEDNSILIRRKLLPDDFVYELDPLKINFTQTTISSWFRANNRRLYCFEKAVKNRAKFNKVPVKIVRETDEKAGFK
ncbi:40311_t:CDS:2 [Gigaspora margarita]|uniref:40311_t:CDS:1 n=1 Tax=Gigaspora margarita TaxID=4874 RepID=A0ABN7UZZ5_GIGMA|nr:40311_t:CDS:2 [Gigaspora margarita]